MKKWEQGGFTTLSWSWSQKQTLIACPRCLYQPLPWAWLCQADLHKAFVNWTFYNYVKLTWNTALSPSYDHLSKNQCFWLDWSKFIICFEATPLADVVKKKKKNCTGLGPGQDAEAWEEKTAGANYTDSIPSRAVFIFPICLLKQVCRNHQSNFTSFYTGSWDVGERFPQLY